jgi:hypothetical protein
MSLPLVEYSDEQSGTVLIGKCSKQKTCLIFNVIYPHPFKVTPIVHITPVNDHKDEDFTFATALLSTTRTGFCGTIRRVSNKMVHRGWSSSIKVNWFATVPSPTCGQITIGPSVVNNVPSSSLLAKQTTLAPNQDYFATATINIPLPVEQQKNPVPPNIILTMQLGDSNGDDTFIATVREIYPNRFVAVIRKVHYDEPTRTWSHALKLNWTAIYPNNTGNEFLKCKTIALGDNLHDEDCIKRDVLFMHKPPKSLRKDNNHPIPTSVIVSARSDPTRPSNETFCFTVQDVTGIGFRLLIRCVSPISWSRGWSQNLYVTYLAHYGNETKTKKKKKLVLSPSSESFNNQHEKNLNTLVPIGEQVHIVNSTNSLVLDIPEFKRLTKVHLWTQKLFIVSQNQRFIFTEDGYLELASERGFVLECKGTNPGQEIFINNKQKDNRLQKWIVYKPATTNSDYTNEVCIASAANLNLVLDCDYEDDDNYQKSKETNEIQSAKGTVVFLSEFSCTRKSQLWLFTSAENRIGI